MQLKKAKELLASLQGQLVKAQQSTLKRVVVEGVASMQPEVENVQELTKKLRECQKEVDTLTREMKMGNSPQGRSENCIVMCRWKEWEAECTGWVFREGEFLWFLAYRRDHQAAVGSQRGFGTERCFVA